MDLTRQAGTAGSSTSRADKETNEAPLIAAIARVRFFTSIYHRRKFWGVPPGEKLKEGIWKTKLVVSSGPPRLLSLSPSLFFFKNGITRKIEGKMRRKNERGRRKRGRTRIGIEAIYLGIGFAVADSLHRSNDRGKGCHLDKRAHK